MLAYEIKGLPGISLSGLTTTRCQVCNKEEVLIRDRPELLKTIARAILNKPSALSGLEFKFLRKTAGLTIEVLARKLGVVSQTILLWEGSSVLRLTNDVTARMVFGAALFGKSFDQEMPKLFDSIPWSEARISEIKIGWNADEHRWEWLGSTISEHEKIRGGDHRDELIRSAKRYRGNGANVLTEIIAA